MTVLTATRSSPATACCRFAAIALLSGVLHSTPSWAEMPSGTEAGPLPTTGLSAAQARDLLGVLQDDTRRQELLDRLRTLAAPEQASPPKSEPTAKTTIPLTPGGLGEQIVEASAGWVQTLSAEVAATTRAVTGFPAMVRWARNASTDPAARARLLDAGAKSGLMLGGGLVVHLVLAWLFRWPRRALDRAASAEGAPAVDETVLPELHPRVRAARAMRLLRRLPGAVLRAILGLLPAVAFAITVSLLLRVGIVALFSTKMVIIEVTRGWLLFWAVVCVARLLTTDPVSRWRLVDLGDPAAAFLGPWVKFLAGIAILGAVLANVAGRLGVSEPAQEGVVKLAALAVHVGLVAIVWRSRHRVARVLQPRAGASPTWATLAGGFAARWHWSASVLLIASWLVWAVQRQKGVEQVLRLCGLTLLVLVVARLVSVLALGALDRSFRSGAEPRAQRAGFAQRAGRYYPALRQFMVGLAVLATLIALLESWGYGALAWFSAGAVGARMLSAASTTLITILLALLTWELANAAIDRHLLHLSRGGMFAQAGRLRTLAPLLRTCLFAAILIVVGLTVLSELGVNIAPLLAGAGIFGVALGFGSQKLVQDFITGIFLLLENAMQVGEWVTVSGLSGTVENLSVRTIRLRAGDGSVHVIPFSSVTTVTNTNRGIGNAAVSVVVSIEEDVDRVGETLKRIAAEMRADPDYRAGIRADLALWGVDKVDASTVTLVGQIECTDTARWGVQREFNRRVKKRFGELGIRLANPAQAVLMEGVDRAAAWSRMPAFEAAHAHGGGHRLAHDPGESAASTPLSPPPAALGNTQ